MSRHRITQCSRSRAIALVAAGALSIAAAATATAATWNSGSPTDGGPGSAHAATGVSQLAFTDRLAPLLTELPHTELRQTYTQSAQPGINPAQRAYQLRDISSERMSARDARAAATSSPATAPQPPLVTVAAPSASPQQIAEAMLGAFGWSSGQFSCLDPLWAHESGWSVTAYNPGTGAYGIPQAMPGDKMASAGPDWQTDAATQIRWGLEYIRDTYGSPCAAWAHEEATGWY